MAKKKSMFEAPPKTSGERQSDYERLKEISGRMHEQQWQAYNAMPPDVTLPWHEQVLDLERRGKPTTIAAHDLAMQARLKHGTQREPKSLPPEQDDGIPF